MTEQNCEVVQPPAVEVVAERNENEAPPPDPTEDGPERGGANGKAKALGQKGLGGYGRPNRSENSDD